MLQQNYRQDGGRAKKLFHDYHKKGSFLKLKKFDFLLQLAFF